MIEIARIVCDFLKVPYLDVFTSSRKRNVCEARQIAMYFIKQQNIYTLNEIGVFFNRDHASVIHSINIINTEINNYSDFKNKILKIEIEISFISQNKIVYIAHPISNDVKANIGKILKIVQEINLTEKNVIPFAPYIVDVMALDDNDPEQRKRGISNNLAYFQSGIIKEVRVYGDYISKGVAEEIALARQLNIQVAYYNPNLQ